MIKPIVITPGDPAGIGPDIVIDLAKHSFNFPLVVVADPDVLLDRANSISRTVSVHEYHHTSIQNHKQDELTILPSICPEKIRSGQPDPGYAPYVLDCLDQAINGCVSGEFSAMVTGPVNKAVINQAGINFTGHTEYIANHCDDAFPVMMLMNDSFRVALVTTHLPLAGVPDAITSKLVEDVIRTVHSDMLKRFQIQSPKILVCGLNPHAGEQGYLGNEEQETIEPVISRLKLDGINLSGPVSADTAFTPASLNNTDVVICMYHDQGLPVLKSAGFGNIVNVTLGLPIIRTSVDHGTAYDLAGTGKADSSSLFAAITCAAELSNNVAEPG